MRACLSADKFQVTFKKQLFTHETCTVFSDRFSRQVGEKLCNQKRLIFIQKILIKLHVFN